ncbi:MAG: hypothetical protein LBR26_17225 [Prevotella sp.]|jgi:hypothetical protein|nr:hypothetical protein [Prevotella sp.]
MKIIKYISIFLLAAFVSVSCSKEDIEYGGAVPLTDEAEFQLHYMVPVTTASTNDIFKVDLNGKTITNNTTPLSVYNVVPTSIGRFFTTKAGTVNLKLYQSTDLNLIYDKAVTLGSGKQNVVVYDFDKPPVVFDNGYPYPYPNDHTSYDTDTIAYVKFYNFMYDSPGVATTLKIQYQYQYTLHPLYTLDDEAKGKIPSGKKVGDATGDATLSAWLNLGKAVGFGETTGWQVIPVKKATYVSQGAARLDYRVIVTAENGGIPGVNVVDDGTWRLIRGSGTATYADYWTATIGRRYHHFFRGHRTVAPLIDISQKEAL